jgi:hypothetical protein
MGWWPGTPSIPGPVTSSNGRASLDTGVGGVFMSKLLGHARRKMLRVGLPPVLDSLDQDGTLRPGSTLRPKSLG